MSVSHPHTQLGSCSDNALNRGTEGKATFGRLALVAVLFVSIAAICGCAEKRVNVFPVSGKVTYKGKPAAGAIVVLHPVNAVGFEGVAPIGTVGDDGSFTLTVYDPGDGAPEGDYVATIQWRKMVVGKGGAGAGPNVLPKQYSSAATSPVKVSVSGGPTEIPPIAIK